LALNLQTFKTRTLTAVLFAAVMLVGLLCGFWPFLILFVIIHFGCWIEYLKLTEKIHASVIDNGIKYFFAFCGVTLMLVFGLQYKTYDAGVKIGGYEISLKIILWILLFLCLMIFAFQNKRVTKNAKWAAFAGFIYISLAFTLFLNLRDNIFWKDSNGNFIDLGKIITCGIVFSIWINDTMAYIVGSLIGKTSFSKISPKKTWEGTIGGAILCVAAIALLGYFIPAAKLIAVKDWIAIAAICAVFGTAGDLLESKIKRMADVKDSGTFMPGHGGFLDRFDSLLVATPFVWLYVKIFL